LQLTINRTAADK